MRNMVQPAVDGHLETFSLVELAVSRLSQDILGGEIDPGERLVEEQLTRRLGISRAPLREALRLLAQQGLVEHVPRRGVRVATLSDRDIRELYEVRDVLERHALTGVPVLIPRSDVQPIQLALVQMRLAAQAGNRFEVANAHRRFHVALVALAENRQMTLVYESVLLKIQLFMAINLRREAELAQPLDGVHRHERLLDAITAADTQVKLRELSRHGATSYLGR